MANYDGINRPIFYRKRSLWACIVNRRNAIIICGALFFTWLGYNLNSVTVLCNTVYV
jgi:hypothetical protein